MLVAVQTQSTGEQNVCPVRNAKPARRFTAEQPSEQLDKAPVAGLDRKAHKCNLITLRGHRRSSPLAPLRLRIGAIVMSTRRMAARPHSFSFLGSQHHCPRTTPEDASSRREWCVGVRGQSPPHHHEQHEDPADPFSRVHVNLSTERGESLT